MSITYSSVAPQPTLAWDFNETTTDYIEGLTGTTTGTVSFNPNGKYGQSLVITNTVDLVAANYVSYTTPYYPSTLTVSLWIKFNTISAGSQYLFELSGTSGGISYVINLGSTNFITLRNQTTGGVASSCSSSSALVVSQWYHITAVIDGSFQYLYVNGVLSGGPVACDTMGLQYRNVRLGGSTGLTRVLVNGELDDLRIFDSVLTAAQIKGLYSQNGMPGRGVLVKTPIQPGYIYELNNNTTNVGSPNAIVIDASNPDPRNYLGGDTGRIAQWNGVPNLLTLWNTAPFKYYLMFLSVSNGFTYPVNIPTTGTYKIEVLFIGPGGNSDSFFIHVDSEADTIATTNSTSFIWLTALTKTLTAGAHTVQITGREPCGVAAIRVVPSGGTNPTLTAFRQNYTGTPLFSQLSSAAASSAVGAFSLRAVNGTTAKAVQVRNGTTSTTTDFYADRIGNLLTAPVTGQSLAGWLGGATGYVATWYDQSGAGNDAIQTTTANQPIIQKATKGVGYMVNFNGTSQFVTLSTDSTFLNGVNITVNAVALRTATKTSANYFFGTNTPSVNHQRFQLGFLGDTSITMQVTSSPSSITIPAYNASNEPVYYMTGGLHPTRVFYQNDTLGGTNSNTGRMSAPSGYSYSIGSGTQGGVYRYLGNLFELLIFTSALDQTQVTQVYQNQLGSYGT